MLAKFLLTKMKSKDIDEIIYKKQSHFEVHNFDLGEGFNTWTKSDKKSAKFHLCNTMTSIKSLSRQNGTMAISSSLTYSTVSFCNTSFWAISRTKLSAKAATAESKTKYIAVVAKSPVFTLFLEF